MSKNKISNKKHLFQKRRNSNYGSKININQLKNFWKDSREDTHGEKEQCLRNLTKIQKYSLFLK